MPFVLTGALGTFLRLMDKVLDGLIGKRRDAWCIWTTLSLMVKHSKKPWLISNW